MDVETNDLSRTFGQGPARTRVLDQVSLTIQQGAFVSIIGASGSGKTTLLNILGGLDRDYTGRVRLDGQSIADRSDRQLSRLRNQTFGFVFQQFHLLDHLTAAENVALPSYFGADDQAPGGVSSRRRAHQLLEQVGLADKVERRPPQLSGGQKQRVAIARALFYQPSIIFCDEPTGSLDRETGRKIMATFGQLNRREEVTLVVVTHEEHLARMASRIIRLEDGLVVADESNEPVAASEPATRVGPGAEGRP